VTAHYYLLARVVGVAPLEFDDISVGDGVGDGRLCISWVLKVARSRPTDLSDPESDEFDSCIHLAAMCFFRSLPKIVVCIRDAKTVPCTVVRRLQCGRLWN
jgi:hypothetical protein